ncbi:MAG: EEP domain-containing protein, partial [Thiohalospira sp.]
PSLAVESVEVLDAPLSDHLPMTMTVRLPEALHGRPAEGADEPR